VLVILAIIVILIVFTRSSSNSSTGDPDDDGSSHIWYRDNNGKQVHEVEACYACIQDRAAELQQKGVHVERVVLGRRHSGDL